MTKFKRKLTESRKKDIAANQYYKCANRPGLTLIGLKDYNCPLWDKANNDIKGIFDKSGYEIDHIEEHCINGNDNDENLQALCKSCHSVKTKYFMRKHKSSTKIIDKIYSDNKNRSINKFYSIESKKIDRNILKIEDDDNNADDYDDDDDDDNALEDFLIRNYSKNNKTLGQVYDMAVYHKAFEMCDLIMPGIFKLGKINGTKIDIMRIKKHKCLMSDRIHDSENAFLIVSKIGIKYEVRFGCYRYCNQRYKTYCIGDISIKDNEIIYIENSFL